MDDERSEEEARLAAEELRLKDIDAAIARARQEARLAAPHDEDIELQLRDIEDRARRVRAQKESPLPSVGGGKMSDESYRDAGVALAVAYNVVGGTIGGWVIGLLIDMGTKNPPLGQALGALIGGVAGVTGAIIMALRADQRNSKK
ncbi:MAG: AtpZ/AtpI family protein [Fimbriimonadaceae bacterium]|nr:AtpZ/AtpI family protein [Fimbriimonadaceae bacterium]QYK56924.1 MAG: AtpZ/AtpI family protein [Fimbriimonadaceae bacterium]